MTRVRCPNVTVEEKVGILREVLLEHRPVSEVCERHRHHPSQYYTW
jgi:transposase-like protein